MENIELIDDTILGDGPCNGNGLVFRCLINTYVSKRGSIEQRKSFRVLKRQSCSCQKCTWPLWDDFLSEEVQENEKILDKCEGGKAYKLVISGYHDYEYGYEIDNVYLQEQKEK